MDAHIDICRRRRNLRCWINWIRMNCRLSVVPDIGVHIRLNLTIFSTIVRVMSLQSGERIQCTSIYINDVRCTPYKCCGNLFTYKVSILSYTSPSDCNNCRYVRCWDDTNNVAAENWFLGRKHDLYVNEPNYVSMYRLYGYARFSVRESANYSCRVTNYDMSYLEIAAICMPISLRCRPRHACAVGLVTPDYIFSVSRDLVPIFPLEQRPLRPAVGGGRLGAIMTS